MLKNISKLIEIYPPEKAPFLHRLLNKWSEKKPLQNLNVAINMPVVRNVLLQIKTLVIAGANVTVCNPHFMAPHEQTVQALKADGLRFVSDPKTLAGKKFDLYFDCSAELFEKIGAPKMGSIEITASGDHIYRIQKNLNFPVISIDRSLTKQLETIFGSAESVVAALKKLINLKNPEKKSWLVFGFGKIGRGLAYYCSKKKSKITVVDPNPAMRFQAKKKGIKAICSTDLNAIQNTLKETEIVITATGKENILTPYSKNWFNGKVLANMGVLDEFGERFSREEVLNEKKALNFVLEDPTPIQFIDPELYTHLFAVHSILEKSLANGIHNLEKEIDEKIIHDWCDYYSVPLSEIKEWFVVF